MHGNLARKTSSLDIHEPARSFIGIIGILSMLSYPIFNSIWGMHPIGAGEYIQILSLFGALFLLLAFAVRRVEALRDSLAPYINWVMPVLCVIASSAVSGLLSAAGYAIAAVTIHTIFFVAYFFARSRKVGTASLAHVDENNLRVLALGYTLVLGIWIIGTYNLLRADLVKAWIVIPIAVLLIFSLLWIVDRWDKKLKSWHRWVIYSFMCLMLVGLIYRPELFFDRWHYNYFMAPINEVLHGRTPFVDTTSQYGAGVIYGLSLAFSVLRFPVGYEGLSFITSMLFILEYLLLAFALWKATEDVLCSFIGVLVIIYFNYLAVPWESILRVPAQGPLRYGLIYLLLTIALLNTRQPRRYFQTLEFFFLGIASVWSLETFAYAILSLDAFHLVYDLLSTSRFQDGVKCFVERLAIQAGVIIISWGLLYVYMYSVSGQFPNMRIYLDYFQGYADLVPSENDLIASHIFRTGAVIFVYLLSIFAVLYYGLQRRLFLPAALSSMLVGMSVAGILQYTYYFIFYLDFHLALLCVPLIFVLAIWMSVLRRNILPSPLRRNVLAFFLFGLMINMLVTAPNFYDKFSKSLFYQMVVEQQVILKNPYRVAPSDKPVELLVGLIQKYAVDEQQIAIFVNPDDQVEALFLTGKIDLLGISQAEMSGFSPTYSQLVLEKAKAITEAPNYIFHSINEKELMPLQQKAYKILFEKAEYTIVDKKKNVVVLKRIDP